MLNRGTKLEIEQDRLAEASRKLVASRVSERLEGQEPYEGKKHRLRTIIQSQARHLATYLRRAGKPCQPFLARW